MRKLTFFAAVAVSCLSGVAEEPYAFRTRLETVHVPGLRDAALKPAADEFVFADGMKVGDADFADYLAVSMGVKASAARGGAVFASIDDSLADREYTIDVRKDGVEIRAADSRTLHQAYYHLEDLMNLRRAPFLKIGKERRRMRFSPRMIHSGYGCDVFPDGYLKLIAHHGFDAIVFYIKDVNKTAAGPNQDVNGLIERAKRVGLDTYLYSSVSCFAHPDDPDGAKAIEESFGRIAKAHPGAKGIVFVGESCQFPSKDPRVQPVRHQDVNHDDPRPLAGWFPCKDYPDWLRAVMDVLHKYSPNMEIVFWTYNWSRQDARLCAELVPHFPDGVAIQGTLGNGAVTKHDNGLVCQCRDYTVSTPGFTDHYAAQAKAAKAGNRRFYTMANTAGLTWDYGVAPYLPCPFQWKKRWDGLVDPQYGIAGLMETHHFGWYPSFISELAKEAYTEGGMDFDEHIRKIAARDFGEANADKVVDAWRKWSRTEVDYVANNENQYGPFRLGPAFPYNFGGKKILHAEFPQDKKAYHTMRWMAILNFPFDLEQAHEQNVAFVELDDDYRMKQLELFERMRTDFADGARALREAAQSLDGARRVRAEEMIGVGEWHQRTVETAINLNRGYLAFKRGDRDEMLKWARAEYANAQAALKLVERDSRLGWEPSMEYAAGPEQIRWKLGRMEKLYGRENLTTAGGASGTEAVKKLPGEDDTKPAISPAPFPDRMSAYVWRNWGLVDRQRLADVVGATVEDLVAVAGQMGLEPNPSVLPEWRRKGYITVLRRNWHLLPYDQLLTLVDMTRDELTYSLMEDDFLWVKLGSLKPKCEALRWSAGMREVGRGKRERIAAILREEGLDPNASEEPRFQFVKELSAVDPKAVQNARTAQDASPFDFRLIFSYFADYGDPLWDPEIGSFPEGLLQKLSLQGVNAVWLHTVLRTLTKDPKYPEWGEGCERRLANLQTLVDRCRKYGIKVFLYMNEPRGMDPSFFKVPGREKLAGATHGLLQALCTLNPETQRWLSDSLEKVFSTVHGLGGIFTITASENLSNCATRPGNKETCPVCKSHTRAEIIAAANCAMIRGMQKGDPNAEALVYKWAWPAEEEEDIINRLPTKGVRLMAVSERGIETNRGGVKVFESDYSISVVGPGENAKRAWGFAKKRGIPVVAKVQAANSWELSSFPYIPAMDLVAEHASNLANEGVNGVMLSWSLGCCPSPNIGVYQEFRKGETDKEGVLDRMARQLYGDKASQARKAWKAFSDGFANYPFSCGTIYAGPHQWGPANPLYLTPTGYRATMVGIPYDHLDGWRTSYPRETYADLIGKVADGFSEGCRLMEGVAEKKELDMFRAEQMHFASCRDQAHFVMARDRGDADGMKKYAKQELARAKAYWPIVRADSRIGYESSNHYFFVPRDLLEKVLSCRAVLDR